MQENDNPLLQPENFMGGYADSIEDLKNHPNLVTFEKLCHAVFSTEDGKMLMEYLQENYLMKTAAVQEHPNFEKMCVWGEGFRHAYLLLRQNVKSHEQRIKAGATA